MRGFSCPEQARSSRKARYIPGKGGSLKANLSAKGLNRYILLLIKSLVFKMHVLQPKHSKVSLSEVKELLKAYNISTTQLPRIKSTDKALPKDTKIGDIIKVERKIASGEKAFYYRLVVE